MGARCPHNNWGKGVRPGERISTAPLLGKNVWVPIYEIEERAVCRDCGAEARLDGRGEPIWPDYLAQDMDTWLAELRRNPPPLPSG